MGCGIGARGIKMEEPIAPVKEGRKRDEEVGKIWSPLPPDPKALFTFSLSRKPPIHEEKFISWFSEVGLGFLEDGFWVLIVIRENSKSFAKL